MGMLLRSNTDLLFSTQFLALTLIINSLFQLTNPHTLKPALKFGTVPWTHTEEVLRKKFPDMYLYMKQYNKSNVMEGISSVKRG